MNNIKINYEFSPKFKYIDTIKIKNLYIDQRKKENVLHILNNLQLGIFVFEVRLLEQTMVTK